jgi:hypothetical protein
VTRVAPGFFAALLCSAAASADIFSPGDLAQGHAHLEGMKNCTQCHPAGSKLSQETCLACHAELRPEVAAGKGYHGRISREQRDCEKCHLDHQGRDFKLTDWGAGGIKGFEHSKTGWPLQGKHAQVTCLDCHERRLITEQVVLKMISERPRRENPTMLGLAQRCEACHFDEHRGQTAKECQKCHNEKAWSPAPGFDHQKTAYPLEGKHKKVACAKCHPAQKDETTSSEVFPKPVSMSFLKYAPVVHKDCINCHEDPHRPSLGEKCQQCHSVEGWMIIRNALKEREFHDKTRYPLKGEHMNVACTACHGPFPGIPAQFKNMTFGACIDCHPDAHEGQMPKDTANGPRCENCHSVEGFKPTAFELKEHQKTRYPLEGAHRVVACNACHAAEPKLAERVPPAARQYLRRRSRQELFSLAAFSLPKASPTGPCEACHADAHAGQFKPEQACASCHAVAAWSPLPHFQHDRDTSFPLTGKHASAACVSCHRKVMIGGAPTAQWVGQAKACDACHVDVHVGQFAKSASAGDCGACHDTTDFKKSAFVHAPPFTTYLLEGAHAKVDCDGCHPTVRVAPQVTAVRYRPLPRACEACHADFHKGEFKGFIP